MGVKLGLSQALSEEHRLSMFGNRVLGRVFGLKKDEVIGQKKWHDKKLHNLSSSRNTIEQSSQR
jgi:hypothetical protein